MEALIYLQMTAKSFTSFHPDKLPPTLEAIQHDLDALGHWSQIWKLHFSIDKCGILPIRCTLNPSPLNINGNPIPLINSVRDLGVRYSASLTFTEYIHSQVARSKWQIARIVKHIENSKCRLTLYETIVRPGLV